MSSTFTNEFQYKYGADWNNEFKLGTLAMDADDFGKFRNCNCRSGIGAVGSWLTQWLSKGVSAGKAGGVDVNKLVQLGHQEQEQQQIYMVLIVN